MISFKIKAALAGAMALTFVPASAEDQGAPAPIAGVWSIGETRSCDAGPAWVFFADGYYAEVQLPDGAPSAVGIWRDESHAIAYTHAHMPFKGHEEPMKVRHLTIDERGAEKLITRNYRGESLLFHRCPASSLKAQNTSAGH